MDLDGGYEAVAEAVESSTDAICDLQSESCEMVINVQIANDIRELNRRDAETKSKAARIAFLEEETVKAEMRLDEINSKWNGILKFNDAIDIYNACATQKSKYMEVFRCKNKIIETLKKELSKADEKFEKDQKQQKEDISILFSRINNQIGIMKKAYRYHLDLIQETTENERKILLYKKHQEWISLNEEYAQQQRKSLDETFNVVEEYEKSIAQMTSEHYEKYRALKRKLDFEVQNLHVELERTKSSCLLNERKLEYNYLVLSKRHEELWKIKAAQRRRINKLRDLFSEIQSRKLQCEKLHLSQVAKHKKCISDIQQNIEAMNEKIRRTDDVNENTYRKIWKFNEKRARMFLKKLYNMDKFIYENQFHYKWSPPAASVMKITELPSVQYALRHEPNFQLTDEEQSMSDVQPSVSIENSPILKFILKHITDSMKFLISDRIDSLTEHLEEEKKLIVQFDNTLKLLKINNENDLKLLHCRFAPHVECLTCKRAYGDNDSKELPAIRVRYYSSLAAKNRTGSGNCLKRTSLLINRPFSAPTGMKQNMQPDETKKICENPQHSWFIDELTVIKLLSDFVRDMKISKRKKTQNKPLQKILLSRILSAKDVTFYWNGLRSTFVEEKHILWKAMLPCMAKYSSLLQENINIEAEVQHLLKQNSELEKALENFIPKVSIRRRALLHKLVYQALNILSY